MDLNIKGVKVPLVQNVGVVVIGRNEGDRLKRCLRSIPKHIPTVYVDSGSSDGSVNFSQSMGFQVLELSLEVEFTAARARNQGWINIVKANPGLKFIQFVDGDCELHKDWVALACGFIEAEPGLAVVFGRCRERYPERSLYNRLCDEEWDTPIGLVGACGGNALFRVEALRSVGGFRDDLIAGEEPDLCLRLRRKDWLIRRVDAEMVMHDANIITFTSWWRRTKRGGFAYAEHVWLHRSQSDPHRIRRVISILSWGLLIPMFALVAAALFIVQNLKISFGIYFGLSFLYAIQILRLTIRNRNFSKDRQFAVTVSTMTVIGKFAEALGVFKCFADNIFKRNKSIIEYKS